MITFINGEYLAEKKASISIFDLGIVRGFGVFDFLRTYSGKPFHLKEHVQRFHSSLSQLGISIQKSKEEIERIISELMRLNHLSDANIKLLGTGGVSEDGLMPSGSPTFAVLVTPSTFFPKHYYSDGIKVTTFHGCRSLPYCKSLNYTTAILALQKARKQGAFEALYVDNNKIYEGMTCNFFAFINNTLISPKQGVLPGITREVVIRLAKDNFVVNRRDILFDEIEQFDEVFITSSNKEILPVIQIDETIIRDGKIGPNTKKLMKLFHEYTMREEWDDLPIDWTPTNTSTLNPLYLPT